jgi:hypothetical protein
MAAGIIGSWIMLARNALECAKSNPRTQFTERCSKVSRVGRNSVISLINSSLNSGIGGQFALPLVASRLKPSLDVSTKGQFVWYTYLGHPAVLEVEGVQRLISLMRTTSNLRSILKTHYRSSMIGKVFRKIHDLNLSRRRKLVYPPDIAIQISFALGAIFHPPPGSPLR